MNRKFDFPDDYVIDEIMFYEGTPGDKLAGIEFKYHEKKTNLECITFKSILIGHKSNQDESPKQSKSI